jgi:hypothetical protein
VQQRAKRARMQAATASARIRRGMMRYLFVVLDVSRATLMTDMRPTRLAVLSNLMQVRARRPRQSSVESSWTTSSQHSGSGARAARERETSTAFGQQLTAHRCPLSRPALGLGFRPEGGWQ